MILNGVNWIMCVYIYIYAHLFLVVCVSPNVYLYITLHSGLCLINNMIFLVFAWKRERQTFHLNWDQDADTTETAN